MSTPHKSQNNYRNRIYFENETLYEDLNKSFPDEYNKKPEFDQSNINNNNEKENTKKLFSLEDEILENNSENSSNNFKSNDKYSVYQKIIDKIGLSWYNMKIYLIVSLFFLADGGEMMVLSLILSKLSLKWDLTSTQKGILGSSVFVGIFLGALLCGKFSDSKGRKPIFITGSIIVGLFAFLSALVNDYLSFSICRFFCGLGIGLTIPSAFSLSTEITPTNLRHISVIMIWIFFPFGELFIVILTKIFLPYEWGWRYILAFASFPCILALFLSLYIYESPKFLLAIENFDEGFKELQNIINISNLDLKLTDKIKAKIKEEFSKYNKSTELDFIDENYEDYETNESIINKNKIKSDFPKFETSKKKHNFGLNLNEEVSKPVVNFKILLEEKYKKLSILTWVIFISCAITFYGLIYILPQILEKIEIEELMKIRGSNENRSNSTLINENEFNELSNSNFIELIISVFMEVPSLLFSSYLASFGRIKSMSVGFFFSFIFGFICLISKSWFSFGVAMLKFFISIPDVVIILYVCEAYPTKIRSLGVGVGSSFYRIGGILTPFLNQILFDFHYNIPFLMFTISSFVGFIATIMLPYETVNKDIK